MGSGFRVQWPFRLVNNLITCGGVISWGKEVSSVHVKGPDVEGWQRSGRALSYMSGARWQGQL